MIYFFYLLIFLFLFWLVDGLRNEEGSKELLESNWINETIGFFARNDGEFFFIAMKSMVLLSIGKYLYDLIKKKIILRIDIEGDNIIITYQQLFRTPDTSCDKIHNIQNYNFKKTSSESFGDRIKIEFKLEEVHFEINTNKHPWSIKDNKKLIFLNKRINEAQQRTVLKIK